MRKRLATIVLFTAVMWVLALAALSSRADVACVGVGCSSAPVSLDLPGTILPSTRIELFSDYVGCFLGTTCQGGGWFCSTSGGAGTSCQVTNAGQLAANDFGIGQVDTGTTATGGAGLVGSTNMWQLGAGVAVFEGRIYLDDLSDGTETYSAIAGFIDFTNGQRGADSVGFAYSSTFNGGKWECFSRNNSAETVADSGIAAAADTWYKLGITVNAAGTSAAYTINGAAVCTITTNIPTGVTRSSGVVPGYILKSAGLTQRNLYFDYTYVRVDLTTPR